MTEPSSALRALWAEIPDAECRGWCVASCGPIGAGPEEKALLAERGLVIDEPEFILARFRRGEEPPDCPALVMGRCSVYDVRPTVCRLWGSADPLPCPWGCAPKGGRLSDVEVALLMQRSIDI